MNYLMIFKFFANIAKKKEECKYRAVKSQFFYREDSKHHGSSGRRKKFEKKEAECW